MDAEGLPAPTAVWDTTAVQTCHAQGCENAAGPEGYCEDHEALAERARDAVMVQLEMVQRAEQLDAIRKAARRVVAAENRDTWRKGKKRQRKRRAMAVASRRKNR